MSSTRAQLFDVLTADTTLMAMLSGGLLNETEFTVTSPVPCLVLHYLGPSPHQDIPELDGESWEIKAFDRDQAYFNIEAIIERVRFVLHRKTLVANGSGTSAGLEALYAWRSRAWYDPGFRADTESAVFRVMVLHTT